MTIDQTNILLGLHRQAQLQVLIATKTKDLAVTSEVRYCLEGQAIAHTEMEKRIRETLNILDIEIPQP